MEDATWFMDQEPLLYASKVKNKCVDVTLLNDSWI
jgi:hypothetical protein